MVRRRRVLALGLAGCGVLAAGLTAVLWQAVGRTPAPDPPAPAPQPTTAELLVGTWRWVKLSDMVGPPPWSELTVEYTRDGRVTIRSWYHTVGPTEPQTGTYRLDGDTLHVDIAHPPEKARSQTTRIISVDQNSLVRTSSDTTDRSVVEYERVPASP